jgi:hypothetical protein
MAQQFEQQMQNMARQQQQQSGIEIARNIGQMLESMGLSNSVNVGFGH